MERITIEQMPKTLAKNEKFLIEYIVFINTRPERDLKERNGTIWEVHHIVPVAFGGDNRKENLIKLELKEHYKAHLLLYYAYLGTKYSHSMIRAIFFMSKSKDKFGSLITPEEYEKLRIDFVKANSGENNGWYGKSIHDYWSNDRIKSWVNKRKETINSWSSERFEEYCNAISKANSGKIHSDETKLKMSKSAKNKNKSEKTKNKLSKNRLGSKKITDGVVVKLLLSNEEMPEGWKYAVGTGIIKGNSGENNGFYGKHHTENTKRAIGNKNKKVIKKERKRITKTKEERSRAVSGCKNSQARYSFCKELNIYFGTMQDACKYFNLPIHKIRKMLNNGNSYNEKTLVEITKDEFFNKV